MYILPRRKDKTFSTTSFGETASWMLLSLTQNVSKVCKKLDKPGQRETTKDYMSGAQAIQWDEQGERGAYETRNAQGK